MAKNLGTFLFAANFQVKAAEALDPRMVAASKADLINKANWPSDGDTIYVYKGLIVDCGEDGVYRLIDPAKALVTDYSGWERIDAGAVQKLTNVFSYKGSVATYDALPSSANVGDVYNVEAEFDITSELGGTKHYLGGTNVAWNGEGWDPLAGAIDLSNYATKGEVSEVRATANTNALAIETLSVGLGQANAEIANKVDAVEGSSLITGEKLELIDINATNIIALQAADNSLDARLKTVESMIGDGGEVDLSSLTGLVQSQGQQIVALQNSVSGIEGDITTIEGNITTISGQIASNTARISAIEGVNTEQATQLSDLSTKVANNETSVASHGQAISSLTTLANGHTESITALTTGVSEAKALASSEAAKALADAKTYVGEEIGKLSYDAAGSAAAVESKLNTHAESTELHTSAEEKASWNAAADAINAFLKDADMTENAVDTLVELQSYMTGDAAAATQLVNRVAALEDSKDAYIAADTALLASATSAAANYTDQKLAALGTAASKNVEFFATAAQGALAEANAEALKNVYTKDEVYNKSEVYTKDEVNANIANAISWEDVE